MVISRIKNKNPFDSKKSNKNKKSKNYKIFIFSDLDKTTSRASFNSLKFLSSDISFL